MNSRSLVLIGLAALFLSGVAGCKREDPPKPEPAVTASANPKNRLNMRNPMGPMPKIDPQAMKDYRLDICYYGTLSLRQARDSYLASLGKDEPSEKKLPNFGVPSASPSAAPSAGKPGAPPATSAKAGGLPSSAAAAVKPSANPEAGKPDTAKPAASTAAVAPPPPDRRPFDFALRAPHERNARACTASTQLKEPAMGDVDTAAAAFAPFALELAKDISTANSYYQREEYKKDGFAKGKELHKKLLDEFQKLDELEDKLGAALTAWRKDHPADSAKMEEGQRVAYGTMEDARSALFAVTGKKVDVDGFKSATARLEKSMATLKDFSSSHAADNWTRIMISPFDSFLKAAKEAKVSDKGVEAESFLNLITNFTAIIEARQRAISRAMILKQQSAGQPPPNGDMPPGHPALSPPPEPPAPQPPQ